jgi:translocation and assembly module TamB
VPGAPPGHLSKQAPLRASVDAELASLAPLAPFVGTQAVVNGRLRAHLRVGGTVADPAVSGTVEGDALRVDAPQYAVHVTDGRLRATLSESGIRLDELSFAGGEGRFTAHGTLALPGRAGETRVQWEANDFRVSDRPDLLIVLDGNGALALVDRRIALTGTVRVERGHIEYESKPVGQLGDDVYVKGDPALSPATESRSASRPPLLLDLEVDLGRNLTFTGEGLDAALTGRIHITTGPDGNLRARGTIRTLYGTYYAFGQRLTVDRGRLIFDGPLDDPALDVVALRKNLAVEAGVQVSGTVKVPQVRITSNPPVPENEALSWLITGQGLSGATASDNLGLLSAASGALLAGKGKPLTTRIAERLGLTDISVQSSGTVQGTTSNPVASQVVVFGKRVSDRLTIGYEQGLSLATAALRLEYALTRTLTLRAEAGSITALSLVYRRLFQ